MAYGVMHVEKRHSQDAHGISAENNRDASKQREFIASNINWEKTQDNIFFKKSDDWLGDIKGELHAHGIDKWRKDAVMFIDSVYSASPEFFEGKNKYEIEGYFRQCLAYHEKEYGGHVINAVVHLDESTPHMHVVSVPIVEKEPKIEKDENGLIKPTKKEYSLSAKKVIGNQAQMRRAHDHFHEQVGQVWGLERGELGDPKEKKKHLNSLEYKQKIEMEKLAALQQQRMAMLNELRRMASTLEKGERLSVDKYQSFCERFVEEYGEFGKDVVEFIENKEKEELEQFFDDFGDFDIGDD